MFTHTNPFIIDNGTLNFKSGYSNSTKPIYSSNHSKSFYHFQDQIIHQKCTVFEAGRIQDIDQLEDNYKHIFYKEFGDKFYDDYIPPILILDSINVNEKAKKKFIQTLFEQFNLEVVGFASQVTMELFATGSTTGLVVDSGFGHTQIAPIVEGVILKHNQISEYISGREINQQLISLLEKKGFKIEQILPKLKTIKKNSKGFIVNDDMDYYNNGLINTDIFKQSQYSYQILPDNTQIEFQDTEFGFTSLLLNYIFFNPELKGSLNDSIQNLVLKSLKLYPYELSKLLCKNTVLGGGNTLIKNYKQKLLMELSKIEPNLQFNFVNYDYQPEHLAWKGGQIISELPNSNCYWITKTEYSEHGQSLIDRKLQNSPNFL